MLGFDPELSGPFFSLRCCIDHLQDRVRCGHLPVGTRHRRAQDCAVARLGGALPGLRGALMRSRHHAQQPGGNDGRNTTPPLERRRP